MGVSDPMALFSKNTVIQMIFSFYFMFKKTRPTIWTIYGRPVISVEKIN